MLTHTAFIASSQSGIWKAIANCSGRCDRHRSSAAYLLVVLISLCIGESAYPFGSFASSPAAAQTSAKTSAQTWRALYDQGNGALQKQSLPKAESFFRQALALVQIQSHNPADTEKCRLGLADALALNYRIAEARRLYLLVLDSSSKRFGNKSPHLAPVLLALGSLQESEGDHEAAIGYYNRALSINDQSYGPYSPAFANNLQQLAGASDKAGSSHQTVPNNRQDLSILAQKPGLEASKQLQGLIVHHNDFLKDNDNSNRDLIKDFRSEILNGKAQNTYHRVQPNSAPEVNLRGPIQPMPDQPAGYPNLLSTTAEQTVASAWQQQNQLELNSFRQSETDLNSNVFSRTAVQTNSDKSLAPAFKIVSDAVFEQNRYEKGEPYYQRTIATDIASLGPNHPAVANDLNGLAQLYIEQKRYAEAEPLLKRALSIYKKAYGVDNQLTINTMLTLAATEFFLDNADHLLLPGQVAGVMHVLSMGDCQHRGGRRAQRSVTGRLSHRLCWSAAQSGTDHRCSPGRESGIPNFSHCAMNLRHLGTLVFVVVVVFVLVVVFSFVGTFFGH